MKLLECVPNISDGRRRWVVERIAAAASRPGVHVLDVHLDQDHNRSVLTTAGEPEALIEAVVAAGAESVRWIDLRTHDGVHPRLGALDVVPFVPLRGSSMADAVNAALACARRLWSELKVPCFLYEWAHPGAPKHLPEVRSGAFGHIVPDVGGPAPHPTAGAAAVGAREIMVAYNVNLRTRELPVARRIAASVREQGGGLLHLRALGLELPSRGITQVSMNLTRPGVTTIAQAFEAVAREALRHGTEIADTELVGLAPEAALGGRHHFTLRLASPPKTLEPELSRAFGPESSSRA